MGLTPLFELFTGPLSFHLANYMQRFGWGCSSGKFNPRLPRQTGVNRTVRLLMVLLQLAVKEGTISYSIQSLYSIKGDIIYVCIILYSCIPRSGSRESPSFIRYLKHMEHNIPISDAGETLSFIQYLRCIGVGIDNRPTGHTRRH